MCILLKPVVVVDEAQTTERARKGPKLAPLLGFGRLLTCGQALRTRMPVENQDQQLIDDLDHFHIPEVQRVACIVADTATPHAAFDI